MDAAARGVDALGLALLGTRTDENAFLAPLNIATALGMTLAGANGATASELRSALGGDGDDATLHRGLADLEADLLGASAADGLECPTWCFAAGSAAFVDARLDLYPTYESVLGDPYGVVPVVVDYEGAPEAAADAINAWASEATGGAIDSIADPAAYSYYTLLVLGSAVWFAGNWTDPFDAEGTFPEPFTRADGTSFDVPMMRGTALRAWAYVDGATIVELPYRGDDLVMLLLVPDAPAVTKVVIDGSDTAELPPSHVRADRPFAYLIRDRVTGVILFAGRMDAPPAE